MTIYNTPVEAYHKVMEDNSFSALVGLRQGYPRRIVKGCAEIIWMRFSDQMVDEFGVNPEMEQIYYKRNTINRCEIRMLLGGENQETLIQILESEIELLKKRIAERGVKDIKKHHARLRRTVEERYHRDPRKLTIFEFYNDLNDLKDEVREHAEMPKRNVANA